MSHDTLVNHRVLNQTPRSTTTSKPNFMKLPAELRDQIYKIYIHDNQTITSRPREPALAYTNRQVRDEVLPVYYTHYPLRITSYIRYQSDGRMYLQTVKWYHRLNAERIAHCRRLVLRVGYTDRHFGEPVTIQITVKLNQRQRAYEIEHDFFTDYSGESSHCGDLADHEEVWVLLRNHVVDVMDGLLLKPGIGRFTAKYLDRLIALDAAILT